MRLLRPWLLATALGLFGALSASAQTPSQDLAELDRLQPDVLAADRACKTAGSPDQLIAERLALQIAGRARMRQPQNVMPHR